MDPTSISTMNAMSMFDKLRLLSERAPILARLQVVLEADDAHDRAVSIVSVLQWAARKTDTELDNEALNHVEAILKTREGEEAFKWLADKLKGAIEN